MNFVEGTRLTEQKRTRQGAKFQHLLKPKAGGMAFVLGAMGEQLHKLLDVTIHYPQGTPTYWEFVCGNVKHVQVHIKVLSIQELRNSDAYGPGYFDDHTQRVKFQRWLTELWEQKDQNLQLLLAEKPRDV
jgi:hypothetical protein